MSVQSIQNDEQYPDVGAALRVLLSTDRRYRRMWLRFATRTDGTSISQAAVARVLAQWLVDAGEISVDDLSAARRLKDTVSRALSGRRISPRTVCLFVHAFDMESDDEDLLWSVF